MIPPQARIALAGVVAILLFLSGFQVANWRTSGKMEAAKAAKERAQVERDEAVAFRDRCITDIMILRDRLDDMRNNMERLEKVYQKAISKPPPVVIEYRDRWHTVTETIVSQECKAGVAELFNFIHDLPERPQ